MRFARDKSCAPLLQLDEVRRRLGLVAESGGGLHAIEVDHVIGTVDRCCDFDRCFRPLRPHLVGLVEKVKKAFPEGDFPPIHVIQIDRAYFAVDGHKRLAAAHMLGVKSIDAEVTRLSSPYPINERTQESDIALHSAQDHFLKNSGLQAARPSARIACRLPGQYGELLDVVKAYGYDLAMSTGRLQQPAEVAASWYDCDYRERLRDERSGGICELLSCCSEGELYLMIHRSSRLSGSAASEHFPDAPDTR